MVSQALANNVLSDKVNRKAGGHLVMKYLRWALALIMIAYVGWIALPVVRGFLTPQPDFGPSIGRASDEGDYSGGFNAPMAREVAPPVVADSIQGDTAAAAIETRNTPVVLLWGAVVGLYLLAALLHAGGNLRAAAVYLLGLVADLILTYLTNGDANAPLYDKLLTILAGWDPRYVLTLVAMLMGFLIYVTEPRRRAAKALAA